MTTLDAGNVIDEAEQFGGGSRCGCRGYADFSDCSCFSDEDSDCGCNLNEVDICDFDPAIEDCTLDELIDINNPGGIGNANENQGTI